MVVTSNTDSSPDSRVNSIPLNSYLRDHLSSSRSQKALACSRGAELGAGAIGAGVLLCKLVAAGVGAGVLLCKLVAALVVATIGAGGLVYHLCTPNAKAPKMTPPSGPLVQAIAKAITFLYAGAGRDWCD